jgi:uncharacterized membrane protein YqaE (UPF0057 family)
MKKILFGLIVVFIGSMLFTSCSSENTVLSQFSKRKYLKKYKKEKVRYKDNIDEYQYTDVNPFVEDAIVSTSEDIVLEEMQELDNAEMLIFQEPSKVELDLEKTSSVDYSDWNRYNRKMDLSDYNTQETIKANKKNKSAMQAASEIVIILLCIFLPPLAVYLYEGSITNNFWLDLVLTVFFYFPGMIFAFLVCFAGISI